jgi:vanillate/3-O-methylgallate O-demethylase
MTDLYLEGPDTIRLLSDLGVNSFAGFAVNKAKQFVPCSPDGYVIGDGILFFLDENRVSLVGRPSAHNWVAYHAETGGNDVSLEWDSAPRSTRPADASSTATRVRGRRRSR